MLFTVHKNKIKRYTLYFKKTHEIVSYNPQRCIQTVLKEVNFINLRPKVRTETEITQKT